MEEEEEEEEGSRIIEKRGKILELVGGDKIGQTMIQTGVELPLEVARSG